MKLKKKIIEIVYSDEKENKLFSLQFFLYILSLLYSCITSFRVFLYKKSIIKSYKAPIPVISIGNVTSGGTGKTPFSAYLSEVLLKQGYNPCIIMRGYKGKFENKGGIVKIDDKIIANSSDAGDEAFLTAAKTKKTSVICGKNRVKSVKQAINELGCDIVILDDGFSHLKLKRDIDIILLDFYKPFGNSYVLPRGLLRETKKNIKRADAFIYTRSEKNISDSGRRVFYSCHKPHIANTISGEKSGLKDKVFLFSGLGNNRAFLKSTKDFGFNVESHMFFEDHYSYKKSDIKKIIKNAEANVCNCFVTTMKDYIRFKDMNIKWPYDLVIMDVNIEFFNDKFDKFLMDRLSKIGQFF